MIFFDKSGPLWRDLDYEKTNHPSLGTIPDRYLVTIQMDAFDECSLVPRQQKLNCELLIWCIVINYCS